MNVGSFCGSGGHGGSRGGKGSPLDEIVEDVAADHAVAGWRCVLCTSVCRTISGMRRHAKVHGYTFRVAGGRQRWKRLPPPLRREVLAKMRVSQGRPEDRQRLMAKHFGRRTSSSSHDRRRESVHGHVLRTVTGEVPIRRRSDVLPRDGDRSCRKERAMGPGSGRSLSPPRLLKRRSSSSPRVVLERMDLCRMLSQGRTSAADKSAEETDAGDEKSATVNARRLFLLRALRVVDTGNAATGGRRAADSEDDDVPGPADCRSPFEEDAGASYSASTVASPGPDVGGDDGNREAADAAVPVHASFSPRVARVLSPIPSLFSVTPSMPSSLDVSFSEELAISTLVELATSSLPLSSTNMEVDAYVRPSSTTALDWPEFARRMLDGPEGDRLYFNRLLRGVVGAADLSEQCRGAILDACFALVQEARARFPSSTK